MGSEQKVAVITGASGGIGAALVNAYRDRNYRVVATALSMEPLNGDDVMVVSGDIADRKTAERAISEGMARFGRIDTLVNNAGIFISQTLHSVHRGRLRGDPGRQCHGLLPHHATRHRRDGEAGQRPYRTDHDEPGRPRYRRRTCRAGGADEGWPECRDQIARNRVCQARHPRERGCAGHGQDANAFRRGVCADSPPCTRSAVWARSPTSSTRSSTSKSASFVTGEILHVDGGQSAGH